MEFHLSQISMGFKIYFGACIWNIYRENLLKSTRVIQSNPYLQEILVINEISHASKIKWAIHKAQCYAVQFSLVKKC